MKNAIPLYPAPKVPDEQKLVTVADLDAFSEKLISTLRMMHANVAIPPKKWLKSHQVRRMLNISPGTLQTMRNKGFIPFSRIGGTFFYDSIEIEKILSAQIRPPVNHLQI